MQQNTLSDSYAVSPQIDAPDLAEIARAGFTTVLCNRPDGEVPEDRQAAAIRAAAEAAGLEFVENPFTNGMLTEEIVDRQAATMEAAPGPVLAYCASGTRSTILWLLILARAGADIDAALEAAERAGYQLAGMRPQLEALSPNR